MHSEITIGVRLRTLRRWRGMSLDELAGLSGLSKSHLSRVERGLRALDRRSHIAAIANALRVSETDLVGGPHLTKDPVQSGPHLAIPALRVAIQANTLTEPAIDRARPLDDLARLVKDELEPLRRACDYAAIGQILPGVLDELHWHAAQPADEAAHRLALETLVEACVCATFTTKNLGYPDLAYTAASRAAEAAAVLDDPAVTGKAEFLRLQTLPKAAQRQALLAAERAADRLEPHASATPCGIEALGMIVLSASLAAATLYKTDSAEHWLAEAARLATQVSDDPMTNWQSFSATNVQVWRVTVEVERGLAGGGVLELAQDVNETRLGRSSRRAALCVDVARGLARDARTRDEAVKWLSRAEKIAPQRIRNSATARDTIAVMLEQARIASQARELRGMAARMGIAH
ncbi:transcriptional regulator [Actinomadura rubrobrunea]|uniref:Transcriptional regulator n=1 Tax=Actinomadura rubrobrunea TaxID=115335 RepID=A0A9W6Q080_9ACTN|nr:helix-turn-helix transcriptional regulator [Actinomadura rubrobrunea]GLW65922.1 transcriptional regulator [Actinomadura rubrobrunea]